MNLSTIRIPCNISRFFLKNAKFPSKEVQPSFAGIYVSVVCSMNLTHYIPVLNVKLNATMKPPLLSKNHVSFFCNFPLRKWQSFFNTQYPTNYGGILQKMQRSFWKKALFFQMIGTNPAPYVACLVYLAATVLLCRIYVKKCNASTIFPGNPVRITILLTNGSDSIRQYGILLIKEAMFQQK